MKKKEEVVFCSHCGCPLTIEVEMSRYVADSYLDGKPLSQEGIPIKIECPSCHFIGFFPWIRELSLEKKVQSMLFDTWLEEFAGNMDAAEEARRKAVELFTLLAEEGISENYVIPYIDSLRQLSRFKEASSLISEAEEYFMSCSDHQRLCLLEFEKTCILKQDDKAHQVSEAWVR